MTTRAATRAAWPSRLALRCADWAERWFPDAYVFAALGVAIVALAALGFGATPRATAEAFGKGYWSLIPFTMQMVFVVIGGYVLASAPDRLARDRPHGARAAHRARCRRLRRDRVDAHLLVELGILAGVRRLARACARQAHRVAHGLPRRRRRCVSRPRRRVGDGLEFVGRAVAGEPGEHAAGLARDHRHPPVLANDPAVAVDRADEPC